MGVYLKDLHKPENCDVCPIFLAFTTCGLDRDHCMFQDVPEPHGRLGDLDALINDHLQTWTTYDLQRIANAPTVIPASEEAE